MRYVLWSFLSVSNGLYTECFGPNIVDDMTYEKTKITLHEGEVIGRIVTVNDVDVEIFRGVPYGKEPKRFNPPEPIQNFDDAINGVDHGPSCYQISTHWDFEQMMDDKIMSEDCLTVDIYRPMNAKSTGLLFFVPGGRDFSSGDSISYNGLEQASSGNVVVVVQYRLGLFGFFGSRHDDDRSMGGNYGLMDIKLALQFVHTNAVNLGVDPTRITVNGHGGGASLISILLMNEEFASLVNTAVVQSGGLLNAFKKQAKDPKNELEFLKVACETSALHTDCKNKSVKEKATIIRSMEASKLWRSVMKSKYVAGPLPEDGILFKEDIHTAFKRGNVQTNFKLIITTASYEGSVFPAIAKEHGKIFNKSPPTAFTEMIEYMFAHLVESGNKFSGTQIANKYLYEFKLHKSPGADVTNKQLMALAAQIYGDFQIRIPAEEEARIYSQAGANVYKLHLDLDGLNELDGLPSCCGLSHGKELVYQFGTSRDRDLYTKVTGNTKRLKWEMRLTLLLDAKLAEVIRGDIPKRWPEYTVANPHQVVIVIKKGELDLSIETAGNTYRSKQAIENWKSLVDHNHTEL